MIAEASPIQITMLIMVLALFALVWVYVAARLGAWGVARSWWEFKRKTNKETRHDKRKNSSTDFTA